MAIHKSLRLQLGEVGRDVDTDRLRVAVVFRRVILVSPGTEYVYGVHVKVCVCVRVCVGVYKWVCGNI